MLFLKKKKPERRPNKLTFKGILTAFYATIAAIFLLLLAGLSLAGTALTLTAMIPLFVVFSPVLITAATALLATGFAASVSFVTTALTILMWLHSYEPPPAYSKGKPGETDNKGAGGAVAKPATKPHKPAPKPVTKPRKSAIKPPKPAPKSARKPAPPPS